MSAKTKIVVLHMKELIYTAVFVALGILFIVLLFAMFLPGKGKNTDSPPPSREEPTEEDASPTAAENLYIPGIYTTELVLGGEVVDVEVIVSEKSISSIRLVNLTDTVTTMYPLLQPTFDTICEQILETQSLEGITYNTESKYTSLVLLEAIKNSLDKCSLSSQNNLDIQ